MRTAASLQSQDSSFESRRSFQTGDQSRNHFVQFFNRLDPFCAIIKVSKFLTKQDHCFQFLERTKTNVKKSCEIGIRTSGMSFSNVGRNRNGRPLHLRGKADLFMLGKSLCKAVNPWAKKKALFPDKEFFEVRLSHFGTSKFYFLIDAGPVSFLGLAACSLKLEATI